MTEEYGFDDLRPGDRVKITSISGDAITGTVNQGGYGYEPKVSAFGATFDVCREHKIKLIKRYEPPLPTREGAVGIATVRGTPGVRVMRIRSESGKLVWCSVVKVDGRWHDDEHLTDFEELLCKREIRL